MLRSIVAVAAVIAAAALACSKPTPEPVAPPAQAGLSTPPRFDGVYVSQPGKDDQGIDILRFTANGRVLSLSTASAQALEPAVRLLLAESDRCASGTYEIKAGVLRFAVKSKLGTVEYAGAIRDDRFVSRWQSAINGATVEEMFTFVHVVEDAPAQEKVEKAEEPEPSPSPGGPTSPELTLIPDGRAWFCFRAPAAGVSRCERKLAACDAARKTTASSRKELKLSRCTKQASAFCFTVVQKAAARGAVSCSATEDDCKMEIAGLAAEGEATDYTISTCARQ